MRHVLRPLLAALILLAAAAAPASAQLSTRYVALGDSLGAGSSAGPGLGYVDVNHARLQRSDPEVELKNRSIGGANSSTLRSGTQLQTALADIDDATDTTHVTIDIGGNDGALGCGADTWFSDLACPFGPNFAATLTDLNAALANDPGEEQLVVLTYYNPGVGLDIGTQQSYDRGLLGTDLKIDCDASGTALGLNDRIACIGQAHGATVADVYPGFCAGGQQYMAGDGRHANTAGHAAMAAAIRDLPPLTSEPCEADPPTSGTNRRPLCGDLVVQVDPGGAAPIPAGCADPDDDVLTPTLIAGPAHGTLSTTAPFTYTASPGFVGSDVLRYRSTDPSGLQSDEAKVTFLVGNPEGNQPPVCPRAAVRVMPETTALLNGSCVDVDGNPLTYGLRFGPQHGTLSVAGPSSVNYMPFGGFAGVDSFGYSATDGLSPVVESETRVVVPGTAAPNSAPDCPDIKLAVTPGGTIPLHGACTDDGGMLTYELVAQPNAGTIGPGVNGSLATYVAPAGFTGVATFTYRARDPQGLYSPVATVRIAVGDDVETLPAGGTMSAGAVALTSPMAGTAAIVPKPAGELEGFELLGSAYEIVAPDATPADPLVIDFRVPAAGVVADELVVMRNGTAVAGCTSPSIAEPDPCAEEPVTDGDDLLIRVRTSRASVWHLAMPATRMTLHQPLDRGVANVVRAGRTVPVKIETFVGAHELRDVAPTILAPVPVDCPAEGDVVEDTAGADEASTGSAFTRDEEGDRWVHHLDTAGLARGGCHRYTIRSGGARVGSFTVRAR